MAVAAHRGLYDPDRPEPALTSTRCRECSRVSFPPVGLGCPSCGATEEHLESVTIAARGTVHSTATVHRHRAKGIDGPYAVAEIQLDDGPLIRATLDVAEELVHIGQEVEAHWAVARTDDEGNEVIEPRFVPVGERDR